MLLYIFMCLLCSSVGLVVSIISHKTVVFLFFVIRSVLCVCVCVLCVLGGIWINVTKNQVRTHGLSDKENMIHSGTVWPQAVVVSRDREVVRFSFFFTFFIQRLNAFLFKKKIMEMYVYV